MHLQEYEFLGILGDSSNTCSYKVQNKITKATFTWYAVEYTNMKDEEKQNFLKKLHERKSINHQHLLKFHNYIEHEESKILYVSTDFCKNGTLQSLIEKCDRDNTYLCEEFIVRIIYQICFTFKTYRNKVHSIKPDVIFLSDDYKIQFFNFDFAKHSIDTEVKTKDLVKLVSHLCMLNNNDNDDLHNFINFTKYSKDFSIFIKDLLNYIAVPVSKNIDKILCHPMILLATSQWTIHKCFLPKVTHNSNQSSAELKTEILSKENVQDTIQKLRKWEHNLKLKESKLKEKEHLLTTREKRLCIQEKTVKEKMEQAELYLRRCRETKSLSSGSSRNSHKSKKISYENLDSTYSADCGDSVIIHTSQKLNVEKLYKPRALSDNRRVRFKGHSPLKEIDYNKRRGKPILQKNPLFQDIQESPLSLCKQSEGSFQELKDTNVASKSTSKKSCRNSKIFLVDENIPPTVNAKSLDCRPISWTEDSKRQAFELLRVLNSAIDTQSKGDMKHTYL